MAESALESFLKCSVCLDIMTEPVSLSCHHSFCKRCLTEHWAQQPSRPCPVCRTRSSNALEINFALRELCISFREKLQLSASTQDLSSQTESTSPRHREASSASWASQQWSVCPSHPQVPPLFCLDDSRPFCPYCEFSLHPQHTVVSGHEAEKRLEELISSQLKTLNEDKRYCEELKQNYEDIQSFSEKQARDCERHIRALFSRLHDFLLKEEKTALSALREEQLRQQQNMGPELQKVREKLSSVEKSIQELKEQLETHSYTPRQEDTPTPSRPKAGLLLDQAKVLGNLGFRVWTRMKRHVKHLPVILDPNTAATVLILSEEMSTMRNTGTQNKDLPDVPERFNNYAFVLGSVGYSSGTHQWDVEVGDLPDWAIGVVKESFDRKQECLENGLYYFAHDNGQYVHGDEPVEVKNSPQKIRVKLDHNKGKLSFSDADHMTLLYSHTVPKGTSAEKLFPMFHVGPEGGAKTKELRICEVQSEDNHSMELPMSF